MDTSRGGPALVDKDCKQVALIRCAPVKRFVLALILVASGWPVEDALLSVAKIDFLGLLPHL